MVDTELEWGPLPHNAEKAWTDQTIDSKWLSLARKILETSKRNEHEYIILINRVLEKGTLIGWGTEQGNLMLTGQTLTLWTRPFFPLITNRKIYIRGIFKELEWFLRGRTDSQWLEERKVNIWQDNTRRTYLDRIGRTDIPEGSIGKGYGHQWRNWNGTHEEIEKDCPPKKGIDQIKETVELLMKYPGSRRALVSAWNAEDLQSMALPPCHSMFQLLIVGDDLDMMVYQRSVDLAVGLPFNMASYALLLILFATRINKLPGKVHFTFGSAHIYLSHIRNINEYRNREVQPGPRILVPEKLENILDDKEATVDFNDIEIRDYNPQNQLPFKLITW